MPTLQLSPADDALGAALDALDVSEPPAAVEPDQEPSMASDGYYRCNFCGQPGTSIVRICCDQGNKADRDRIAPPPEPMAVEHAAQEQPEPPRVTCPHCGKSQSKGIALTSCGNPCCAYCGAIGSDFASDAEQEQPKPPRVTCPHCGCVTGHEKECRQCGGQLDQRIGKGGIVEPPAVEVTPEGIKIVREPAEPDADPIAQFRAAMRRVADELAEATLERLHSEAIFKTAKKRQDAVAEKLAELANRGPEHLPLFDGSETPSPDREAGLEPPGSNAGGPPNTTNKAAETPAGDGSVDPNAWRSCSIEQLQLPPGLEERLKLAGCGTIGELEQARAEDRLRLIPRVGPAAVTKVEDAVLAWLSEHRDAAVFGSGAAGGGLATHPQDSHPPATPEHGASLPTPGTNGQQPEPPAGPRASEASLESYCHAHRDDPPPHPALTGTTTPAGIAQHEPAATSLPLSEQDQLRQRAAELNTGEEGCLNTKADPKAWIAGRDAFQRGDDLTDCAFIPGDTQDDWLRGWLTGRVFSGWEDAKETPAAAAEGEKIRKKRGRPRKQQQQESEVAT